jgi:hypothetical protein
LPIHKRRREAEAHIAHGVAHGQGDDGDVLHRVDRQVTLHFGDGMRRRLKGVHLPGFARHQERHIADACTQVVTDVAGPDHLVDGFLNFPLVGSADVRV